jgi:hypothetical protein
MKKYRKETKKQQQQNTLTKPGNESVRNNREDMNLYEKKNIYQTKMSS